MVRHGRVHSDHSLRCVACCLRIADVRKIHKASARANAYDIRFNTQNVSRHPFRDSFKIIYVCTYIYTHSSQPANISIKFKNNKYIMLWAKGKGFHWVLLSCLSYIHLLSRSLSIDRLVANNNLSSS